MTNKGNKNTYNRFKQLFCLFGAVLCMPVLSSCEIRSNIDKTVLLLFFAFLFSTISVLILLLISFHYVKREKMISTASARTDNKLVFIYTPSDKKLVFRSGDTGALSRDFHNVPDEICESGFVDETSFNDLIRFFEAADSGTLPYKVVLLCNSGDGTRRWYRADAERLGQKYRHEVLVTATDVTLIREQELAYSRFRHELDLSNPETFCLLEYNLTRNIAEHSEGSLFTINTRGSTFDGAMRAISETFVSSEHKARFNGFIQLDSLLSRCLDGVHLTSADFIFDLDTREPRWVRLDVRMHCYSDTSDIKVSLLFTDINDEKHHEMMLINLSQRDRLTGIYNRASFEERVSSVLAGNPGQHVLLYIDLDGFKQVNDYLGHMEGDEVLKSIAMSIRSILRADDLVGRIGGDEFMAFLANIPYDTVAENKAAQICAAIRRTVRDSVPISSSIGIAVAPRDGTSFSELYLNADRALYHAKESGKDRYCFYRPEMQSGSAQHAEIADPEESDIHESGQPDKLLVVDSSEINILMLTEMFKNEYGVLPARDAHNATKLMRQYNTSIIAVLLELDLPYTSGLDFIRAIQRDTFLSTIPIIAIGDDYDYAANTEALNLGAIDYVCKPYDNNSLRARVSAAVIKRKNERRRAESNYLILRSEEIKRYRCIIDSTGISIVTYNQSSDTYEYDDSVSHHLHGNYDHRPFWQILNDDGVADTETVSEIRTMLSQLQSNRKNDSASIKANLMTTDGKLHRFAINAVKTSGVKQSPKIIITLSDISAGAPDEVAYGTNREDEIPGFCPRGRFIDNSQELLCSAGSGVYAILYLEIMNLKLLYGANGHEEGNLALRYSADILRDALPCDSLLGRIGPYSLCALTRTPEAEFAVISEKLISGLHTYKTGCALVASIGWASATDPELQISDYLDRAAFAQSLSANKYQSELSSSYSVYGDAASASVREEQLFAAEAEASIAAGQLEVWYQPVFNADGKPEMLESLVRWKHPEYGIILPEAFIPVLEKIGTVTDLDRYVWDAVKSFSELLPRSETVPISCSFNVSAVSIRNKAFINMLIADSDFIQSESRKFVIEITEQTYLADPPLVTDTVYRLRSAGYSVCLDNFGKGLSSFTALRSGVFDVLKFNIPAFHDAYTLKNSEAVSGAVVMTAKNLGMSVVAKNVESASDAEFAEKIGCERFQGNYYSKPSQGCRLLTSLNL